MTFPAHLPADRDDPDAGHDPALLNAYATGEYARAPAERYDGWTAEKQRIFLSALAEGTSIARAAGAVGMSRQSAYALRNAARGQAFALGWDAALLRARDVLADALLDRGLHGYREHVTDDDGRITTRFRYDNALAMRMLNRLDRLADAPAAGDAARLVAAEFEAYLGLIARDGGPARAGLFLGARLGAGAPEPASADDLAPIRALARADRWLRTHTDLADPAPLDLDPARRAEWTAADWARAEAAGLVQLAPPAPADTPEVRQLGQPPSYVSPEDQPEPVWWDEHEEAWRTRFPPPEIFDGEEDGEFGEQGYSRTLDSDEIELIEAPHRAQVARRLGREEVERAAWFAACAEEEAEVPEEEAADAAAP